jgi:energy-coupling factor transporter ATP-binding protein EcfA2
LEYFTEEYTKAINSLSFTAINENASLASLLTTCKPKDRSIYYPKEKIPSYSHPINSNRLASTIRPIVKRYFGVISDDDVDFMDKCYVSQREYKTTYEGMHSLIHDSLTPYFEEFGVQQLDDTGKGGQLGGRLTKNIKKGREGEVLVLFGGKGAGKSTFIKRLLHHNPPRWLREHAVTSIVDLLKVPEDKEVIRTYIWDQLVKSLDRDGILDGDRDIILEQLFSDKYEVAKKQDLNGFKIDSEIYNSKLNSLISEWKNDKKYCAKRLVDYWSAYDKGTIIVVDNTDQYSSSIQDFCFTSAQEISSALGCVTLISMREERFYVSKIHGVLDAFQNSGFHISSPNAAEVFKKRLSYAANIIKKHSAYERNNFVDQSVLNDCGIYLNILEREFSNYSSPLTSFLSACSHGDTRLSLDLFSSFLLSGYTNVDEMISAGYWNFRIHQVIKPVMIPNRYFYDESLSDIPNIYQLRSNRHSSHFTGLRILRKISKGSDKTTPSYHSIAELRAYFSEVFNMAEDFEKNVDVLLKHSCIESNNRLDAYSDNVDSIKVTNYGLYMANELAYYFTYLDLICTDCGIFTEKYAHYLSEAAKKEYRLFTKGDRISRIVVRLERVENFLKYLREEEYREKEAYSLEMPESEMFTNLAIKEFETEKDRVMKSAKKQDLKKS